MVELVKVRTPFRFYMIALSFKDEANLSDVDNELRFLFDIEVVKVRTLLRFYKIASLLEDEANLSGVD